MKKSVVVLGCCILAVIQSGPAQAQISGDTALAKYSQIAARLCFGKSDAIVGGKLLPVDQRVDDESFALLAEAILTETKIPTSALFAAKIPDTETHYVRKPYGQELVHRMGLAATGNLKLPFDPDGSLRIAIRTLSDGLRIEGQKSLVIDGIYPAGDNPFISSNASWSIRCPKGEPIGDEFNKPLERPRFAVRKTPEDLSLSGDAAKEAGAFAVGIERTWTREDDGSKKRSTTVKFDGTVGYQLMGKSSPFSSYAFARYNLDQARTKPAAALAAGATAEDDDTNVLQLGLNFDYFRDPESTVPFWITGDAGYIMDFVDNSRRIRLRSAIEPGFTGDLGICRLGSGKFAMSGKLAFRCLVRLEADFGIWTKDGRFADRKYDDHLAIGGNVDFSAFYYTGAKSKVIASANARYLPVLLGKQNDIWRYDLSLAHRQFFDFGGAVDVGIGYQHGLNSLTLKPERKFTFGLGLLY